MTLDEQIKRHTVVTNSVCPVGKIFNSLNETDKKTLLNAFITGVPTATVFYALQAEGFKVGKTSIGVHRDGKCRCPAEK